MESMQGVRTKLVLVSNTHGSIRIPLAQSFNYTPKITERTINEFDNLEAAQVLTTFEGCDVSFDYFDSDSVLVESSFADASPASTVVFDDPSNYQQVNMFANVKSLSTGKIFAGFLAKECKLKGAPYTEPVKEEARVTRDLSATNVIKVKGAAIGYTRITADTTSAYQQVVPPNAYADVKMAATTPYAATMPETGLIIGSVYYLWVLKNGVEVTTGFTLTATTFTPSVAPTATDVWEVFSIFTD